MTNTAADALSCKVIRRDDHAVLLHMNGVNYRPRGTPPLARLTDTIHIAMTPDGYLRVTINGDEPTGWTASFEPTEAYSTKPLLAAAGPAQDAEDAQAELVAELLSEPDVELPSGQPDAEEFSLPIDAEGYPPWKRDEITDEVFDEGASEIEIDAPVVIPKPRRPARKRVDPPEE